MMHAGPYLPALALIAEGEREMKKKEKGGRANGENAVQVPYLPSRVSTISGLQAHSSTGRGNGSFN